MLLRRVTGHVQKQNWFAVGVDFAIVVVGVFVGIQVSNWNEGRIDRTTGERHLAEIAEDLQEHLDFHELLYGSALARIGAANFLLEAAGRGVPPGEVRFSIGAYSAPDAPVVPENQLDNILGWLNLVRVTVSARKGYESLISSGNLGLLRNRELARQIQRYYGQYDDLLDTQKLFRGFRDEGVRAGHVLGLSAFDQRPIDEVVSIVRDSDAYAAYVRTTREWAILHAAMLDNLLLDTEVLLAAIERELGTARARVQE